MVGEVSEAIIHHVKRAMNTCCRSRVKREIRACFAQIMTEAMEPGFLDDIATQILNLRNPGSLVNFIANIILDF